jgi:hypothetical protein
MGVVIDPAGCPIRWLTPGAGSAFLTALLAAPKQRLS